MDGVRAMGAEKTREGCKILLFETRGFLDLQSWKRLATVMRIPHSKQDVIMRCGALATGSTRFSLWCKMLEESGDSPQFKEMTERERKEQRRRPEILRENLECGPRENEFKQYLETAHDFETSTRLTHGVCGEIWRDVSRTLPAHPFFKDDGGIGQTMLGRILSGVAAACPSTGYCQGMNYLVAALLLGRLPAEITGGLSRMSRRNENKKYIDMDAESANTLKELKRPVGILTDIIETFTADTNILYEEDRLDAEFDVYMFIRRLEKKGSKFSMVGMWEVGTPHMKLKVFQLESIMRWAVPRLHAHFEEIGFQPEILVSQWFMTHFSYMIPLDMLLRLWDYTFLMGWPGIYRIAIALLMAMEEMLLAFDLDDLGKAMRHLRAGTNNVLMDNLELEDILRRANDVVVTEGVLQQLQENFALEMISAAEVSMAAAIHEEEEQEKARNKDLMIQGEKSAFVPEDGGLLGTLSAMKQTVNGRVEEELRALSSASAPSSGVGNKMLGVLSGREASNWLLRYGDTLEGAKALEMLRIRDELKDMEVQIDLDKQSIQEKIVHACEVCRTAEDELANATTVKERMETKMIKLRDMYTTCMKNASTLAAMAASKIKQHEDIHGETPVTLADFHENHASCSPRTRTSSKTNVPSFGGSIDSLLGGLSPLSSKATRSSSGDGTVSTTGSSSPPHSMSSFEDEDSDLEDVDLSISVSPMAAEGEDDSSRKDDGGGSVVSHDTLHSVALSSEPATPPRISISLTAALEAEIARSAATVESIDGDGPVNAETQAPLSEGKDVIPASEEPSRPPDQAVSDSSKSKQRGLLSSIRKSTRSSLQGVAISLGLGSASPKTPKNEMSPSERELHEHLTNIGLDSQKCQQNIIIINRSFTSTQANLQRAHDWHTSATLTVEEASQWKKSLCDQLQLLVEDANRERSQRLRFVANNYLF